MTDRRPVLVFMKLKCFSLWWTKFVTTITRTSRASNVRTKYPTHACLNVDEIVRLVARELVASGGGRTAVSLACCSKSFEDPLLDALWAGQETLLPLLRSLPGDVWKEGGYRAFERLPTRKEWARFQKYARRIRELKYSVTRHTPSPECFSAIQLYTINEPLLPNLKTLELWTIGGHFIQFIPLFLSQRTTSITFGIGIDLPEAKFASVITSLPTLCPDLQTMALYNPPISPMITAAVSGMLLVTNRNTLQRFSVGLPLTKDANKVLYELPNLRYLSVFIGRETPLPSASLPNLTRLSIACENEDGWPRLFHGATLGKLERVEFYPRSKHIGDFLGVFKRAALSSSIQNTLSKLRVCAGSSWNPTYSSLLPFTKLVDLEICFSCNRGCSSRVDDNIIISLSRAMPKLKTLILGHTACGQVTGGVTPKGLLALAHHCPKLSTLSVHLKVASLCEPPGIPGMVPAAGPGASWTHCALGRLVVGEAPMPEGSVVIVAMTLLRIFPRLGSIKFTDERWGKVENAINRSREIINCSRVALETGN